MLYILQSDGYAMDICLDIASDEQSYLRSIRYLECRPMQLVFSNTSFYAHVVWIVCKSLFFCGGASGSIALEGDLALFPGASCSEGFSNNSLFKSKKGFSDWILVLVHHLIIQSWFWSGYLDAKIIIRSQIYTDPSLSVDLWWIPGTKCDLSKK